MHALLLAATLIASPPDTQWVAVDSVTPSYAPTLDNLSFLHAPPVVTVPVLVAETDPLAGADTTRRPRAIHYSDAYYTRLKIHQVASYLTVPLFVAQYFAGRELINKGHDGAASWARDLHGPLAVGIAGLFAVNTVTGVWNLYDSRKDPHGRTRRWVHGLSMIAADAGFVAVGMTAPDHEGGPGGGSSSSNASTHRDLAIASMGVALGSYVMMLLWKD